MERPAIAIMDALHGPGGSLDIARAGGPHGNPPYVHPHLRACGGDHPPGDVSPPEPPPPPPGRGGLIWEAERLRPPHLPAVAPPPPDGPGHHPPPPPPPPGA